MNDKVFVFQLHNNETNESDYVLIAESFETVKKAFDEKVKELKRIGVEFDYFDEAKFDEDTNEYDGFFQVTNTDGTNTMGKIYDYHIFK